MRNDLFLKEMGGKIKKLRRSKKMTLQQVSELTGFNITAISFLENGRSNPHLLTIKSIADVLEVNVKDLI
jgi:transcriptional regulator with XRE-family HTH domain